MYTGGPFPLGYNGLGDIFVIIFFGVLAVPGTIHLQGGDFFNITGLVIGVIMNSMEESNAEMAIRLELQRRKSNPEPLRDRMHDLHAEMEKISKEMTVIKAMLEEKREEKVNAMTSYLKMITKIRTSYEVSYDILCKLILYKHE